jgi:hypothetical protein
MKRLLPLLWGLGLLALAALYVLIFVVGFQL